MGSGEKKAILIFGIVLIAAAVVAVGLYLLLKPRLQRIDESAAMSAEGVTQLVIEATISDVNITVGGSEFKAHLYGKAVTDEDSRTRLAAFMDTAEPGRLVIREQRDVLKLLLGGESLKLDVTIPAGFEASVIASSVSGRIRAERMKGHYWSVTTVSGAIELNNCGAGELEKVYNSIGSASVGSTSGTINVSNFSHTSLVISSTSGSVVIDGCETGNLHVETVSGAVTIHGADVGGLTVSTTSGGIQADMRALRGGAQLDSTSGSVDLALPKGQQFEIDASSVSGSIKQSDSSVSGSTPVTVATISGDIGIKAK